MNELSALEHNLLTQLVPLIIKDPVLRLANYLAERGITAAFSNVGKVAMPLEMARYIDSFHVFTSTNRLQACMCSFGEHCVISFSSPFVSTDIQRGLFPPPDGGRNCGRGHIQPGTVRFLIQKEVSA